MGKIDLVAFQKTIQQATFEELQSLRTSVESENAILKSCLENAKAERLEGVSWNKGNWYRRASHYSKMLGRQSQMICAELAVRKEQRRKESKIKGDQFLRCFMKVAKMSLPKEIYDHFIVLATEMSICEKVEVE